MRLRISLLPFLVLAGSCALGQSTHYLDCSSGSDAADSLTPQNAWRTVAKANSYTYLPGDRLLLRRGTRCDGMLWPKGSGTEHAPNRVGAYGRGSLPIIVGGDQSAGLKLENQQFWEIEDLEIVGGSPYGIHISGDVPHLQHFHLTNVVVHDVSGTPTTKDSGLVVIAPDSKAKTSIDDVIVDGVTAYQTSEWAGIIVNGSDFDLSRRSSRGEHVEIRNSIVHDVAGDGILLANVVHGVLEHNVAWYTGMQETQTIGTPNAIWEWMCSDCRVEYNEGFFSDSPGVDGGVFDIDYGDENNRVENNFGHDSQGYCISVFGAEGPGGNSVQSVVRHNTCIHNGRSPRLARRQGAMLFYTWNGGKLNGVDVEDNTIVWDPPLDVPAVQSKADLTGNLPNRFIKNTVISTTGSFILSSSGIQISGNRFCGPTMTSGQTVSRDHPGTGVISQDSDQAATSNKRDESANSRAEICDCLREIIRKASPADLQPEETTQKAIRAALEFVESSLGPPQARWMLVAVLTPPGEAGAANSRSDLVVVESMMQQFANLGLASVVVPSRLMSKDELEQWRADWNFDRRIQTDATQTSSVSKAGAVPIEPILLLISPSGKIAASWHDPISPADVWLDLQNQLGAPPGMQQMPACSGCTR